MFFVFTEARFGTHACKRHCQSGKMAEWSAVRWWVEGKGGLEGAGFTSRKKRANSTRWKKKDKVRDLFFGKYDIRKQEREEVS